MAAGPITWWLLTLLCSGCLVGGGLGGGAGDADPLYRKCVQECERTGQAGGVSSSRHCGPSPSVAANRPWYSAEALHARWRRWNCKSDCRHGCVAQREGQREKLGLGSTVKYHGKWPLIRRAAPLQESISTALPVLNLATQLHGWLSFSRLLRRGRAPPPPRSTQDRRRSCYEYAGLMHVHALLATNAWFWSALCHAREFELTEQLDYTSAVALVGYSLILAVCRTFGLRDGASRVVVASPLLGFVMTHICYLLFADLDYELNVKVCNVMGTAQLLLWSIWARRHPSRLKLWVVGLGGGLAMLLEACDFPPYKGYVDARTVWHAACVPLTGLWWSFVKDDARYSTSALAKKLP